MGLNVTEFYELSPVEFFEALVDQQIQEQTKIEITIQTMWETTRMHMLQDYNLSQFRKKIIKNPKELFKLPWDNEKIISTEPQTVEQMKGILKTIFMGIPKGGKGQTKARNKKMTKNDKIK